MATPAVPAATQKKSGSATKADIPLIDTTQQPKPFGKLMGVSLNTMPLTKDAQDIAQYFQDKTGDDWVQIQVFQAASPGDIKALDQLLGRETIRSLNNLQPGYTDKDGNNLPFGKGLNPPWKPSEHYDPKNPDAINPYTNQKWQKGEGYDPKNPKVENPYTLNHDPRNPAQLKAIAALDNLIWGGPDGGQSAEDTDKNLPQETTVALKTGSAFQKDIFASLTEPPPDPSTVGSDPHAQNVANNSSIANAAQNQKTGSVTNDDGTPNERGLINQKLQAVGRQSQVSQQKKQLSDPEKAQFQAKQRLLIEAFKADHPNAEVISTAYDNNDDTHDDRWYFLDRKSGTLFVLDFGSNG